MKFLNCTEMRYVRCIITYNFFRKIASCLLTMRPSDQESDLEDRNDAHQQTPFAGDRDDEAHVP